ncbi:MAG: phenylalanine--tRNA ligase subunit alpha [Chloroflexi bacterium]|nr:phenylalanine--tRNA ligase subunit alpha [Chloroflexota bacterium]
MVEDITALETTALGSLTAAEHRSDRQALEQWRLTYLGSQGQIRQLMRCIGQLPLEERRTFGSAVQSLAQRLEVAYKASEQRVSDRLLNRELEAERIDVTLPGRPHAQGLIHPLRQTLSDVVRAFANLGFQAVEGPEVEWDTYNFELLNIPANHPARDMWDTLWITDRMLLRTHTSPMQVRTMRMASATARRQGNEPPALRIVVPGRTYRYEQVDATHESQFMQLEGLLVDHQSSFSDLKGVLTDVARQLFGQARKTRFRCDYFPFVEPGAELAMDCFACEGRDPHCRVCHGSGWIEILGCGMVHPKVLENGGYDPQRYRGFAFGLGIERITMLRHGIDDIRLFYLNDVQLWRQVRYAPGAPRSWNREVPE